MKLDTNLSDLPLTKTKSSSLESLFGTTDIDPYWVADMEYEIAEPIQAALTARVANSSFGYEYKPASYFMAQRSWYKQQYGIDLDTSHVLYAPSITTSMSVIIEHFSNEGEGVIIQPPVFGEFADAIRHTKRSVVKNPLKLIDDQYQINFEDLAEKASMETSKILIICNPHNPVGRVWTREEIHQIVKICNDHQLLLISDEIHKDIILFDHKYTSALTFIADYAKIIVCTSEAKTFNLCGISDSMAIIHDESIRDTISRTFKKYNLGRTNALTRVALEAAYNHGSSWLKQVIHAIENNITSMEEALQASKIKLIRPEGTYQVWLDCRDVYTNTREMHRHITDTSGVGLNAGHWYGREGALFMRMNIATSNEKVVAAIKRIISTTSEPIDTTSSKV